METILDEVGQDLGVGVGDQGVALSNEPAGQLDVILDDAVVHQCHAARTVKMRRGVELGGMTVRGPAGVPHPSRAPPGQRDGGRSQRGHRVCAIGDPHAIDRLRRDQRHTSRVISSVLEPLEAIEEDVEGIG